MSNEQPTPPHQPPGQYGSQYGGYGGQYGPPAGPYGAPAAQPGPYAQQPHPGAPAASGVPGVPPHNWAGVPPYYDPSLTPPPSMPGSVRAAQVLVFVTFGLGVLLTGVIAVAAGAYAAGQFFGAYLATVVLFILALRYGKAGHGVRVASIVLASVQILFALSATAQGIPLGILPLGTSIAVVILLSQGSAGAWFRRQHTTGMPPQYTQYG